MRFAKTRIWENKKAPTEALLLHLLVDTTANRYSIYYLSVFGNAARRSVFAFSIAVLKSSNAFLNAAFLV